MGTYSLIPTSYNDIKHPLNMFDFFGLKIDKYGQGILLSPNYPIQWMKLFTAKAILLTLLLAPSGSIQKNAGTPSSWA